MAGVFTHNGNIVEGLPSTANMINYDNTSSGMQATQLQAAVDELNTNKQSKTDNNLATTDKTVTGSINELKSGLTTLDDEVNGDATVYPYADVITIEDAVPSNLADCSVKIEPVQDLHGQSAPYLGGAGKNVLPLIIDDIKEVNVSGTWNGNVYTYNDVTFTILTDNDGNIIGIKATGTASANTNFFIKKNVTNIYYGKKLNGSIGGGSGRYYLALSLNASPWTSNTCFDSDVNVTIPNDSMVEIYIRISNGYAISAGGIIFYPMISDDGGTFAPYTNICPISGHTEASVQRDGKNLLDDSIVGLYQAASDPTVKRYGYAPFAIKAGVYTISYTNTQPTVKLYLTDMTDWTYVEIDASGTTVTITKDTTVFLRSGLSTSEIDFRNNFFDTIVELGQNATTYVPYAGKTYTIALGSTIYGGTVDFDSGVMTVDKATKTVTTLVRNNDKSFYQSISPTPKANQMNISQIICDRATTGDRSNINTVFINASGALRVNTAVACSTGEEAIEYYGGSLTVCYELATHTTIQLTPQQIQLLKGTNTITASTGQISVTVNGVSGSIGAVQEQVNELAEDVALKQDKTDNTLQTTDKTVVGAVNELKSGLTNYQAQNNLNLEVPNRVNLIESLQDAYFETNGIITASNIRVSTSKIIKIPKGTYTVSAVSSVSGKTVELVVSQWENNKTDGTNTRISVSKWTTDSYTFTVNSDSYVSVVCRYSDGSITSKTDFSVQLELGSTATAYAPYIPSVESRIEAVESSQMIKTSETVTLNANGVSRLTLTFSNGRLIYAVVISTTATYLALPYITSDKTWAVKVVDPTDMSPIASEEVEIGYGYIPN